MRIGVVDGSRTLSLLLFSLAALSGPAAAQQPSASPPPLPVFPVGVEQVVVDVVVVDAQGRPVTGLTAEDFVLREEGAARPILTFESVAPAAETGPSDLGQARLARTFAIVFDDVHLTAASGERVKRALSGLLSAVLQETDEVALVRTSGAESWGGRVGPERASLLAAIQRLEGLRPPRKACEMSDEEARQIYLERNGVVRDIVLERYLKCRLLIRPPAALVEGGPPGAGTPRDPGLGMLETWATEQHMRSVARLRSSYRTLERLLRALVPLRGRKSVILASEGFVRDHGVTEVKGVVTAASDANAAVYFLDGRRMRGSAISGADSPAPADSSELGWLHHGDFLAAEAAAQLAEETGGRTIAGGDLAREVGRLADESRSYYLLGYSPADPALDGKFRGIRVDVRRPGLTVRARRGYYAVRRESPASPNVAVTAAPPAAAAAATAPTAPPAAATAPFLDLRGTLSEAAAQVSSWSEEQTQKAVAGLRAGNAPDEVVERTALAHAVAALSGAQKNAHHAQAAAQLCTLVRDGERRRSLERPLLLGMADHFLEHDAWPQAQDLAAQAVERAPDDAETHLVLGIIQEATGSIVDAGRRPRPDQTILNAGFDEMTSRNPVTGFAAGVPGGPVSGTPQFPGRMAQRGGLAPETRLRRAAEAYRKSLKARPEYDAARLRLGRVLALLGEEKEAEQHLERVAAGTERPLAYLARLFLGDLREQRGDTASALQAYRTALDLRPRSTVAGVAVARTLHASDRAAAGALLADLLAEPAAGDDPWWQYRLRPLGRWGQELATLLAEAGR
jgi:VWFA-related protein